MKGSRFFLALTLVTSLAILPSAIAGEKSSNKAAGPSPTTVVNTILSGSGVPKKTLGINGDFYIDTKNLNLYGPKTKGVWKVSTSLRSRDVPVVANVIGESGAMGQTGAKGATGERGATGATGAQGVPGIQGLTGLIGATGLAGATGPAGTAGTPGVAGAKGDTGSQGIQGAKGDTGSQGIQGAKGDTGTTGAQGDAGVSISKFSTVPLTTLATGADGSTSSSIFFTADSNGNYTFEVLISGVVSIQNLMKLYAEIVIGNMAIGNQFTVASDAVSGVNGLSGRQYGFRIIGSAANVTSGTSFSVRVGIVNAVDSININFTGKALVNKVGSIG
jgi:hypothetical protein